MADESVEELVEEEQWLEASTLDGMEDAADHDGRQVHTHMEYGRAGGSPSA